MNRVTEILGIDLPIIQAPMTWVTSAELVAAVSNAGGMGVLGPNAGQYTVTRDPIETAERLRSEIRKTRELTDKPFGVNYFGPYDSSQVELSNAILNVMVEENIKVVFFVGFSNPEEIKKLKDLGLTVVFRESTPTVKGARDAEKAGADIIIATGFDEGGSTPDKPVGTMTIVPLIVDAVSIPVLATGGIADKRGVNAAFALGAEGVYLGTLFNASKESRVHEKVKQALVQYGAEDLVLLKTGYGSYWRAIPNAFALEVAKLDAEGIQHDKNVSNLKKAMLDGDFDEGTITVSSGIEFIKDIKSCQAIIEELMSDVRNRL
ncbi:NAD(P)H-dependent flavin oxidoreductase [Bacillus inaquosorum]|uniref:NAD(P)H-dependent flavin oxidoreductase n=1 Tax=Bacillus inaquosorum TaxID=483913 RepID=UPI0034CF8092